MKDSSDTFPLGVKTTYRAFSCDSVKLIWSTDLIEKEKHSYCGINVGYQAVSASVKWEPRCPLSEEEIGTHVLLQKPNIPLLPQGFVLGCRASIDRVVQHAKQHFGEKTNVAASWSSWDDTYAPKNDHAISYWGSERPSDLPSLEPLGIFFREFDNEDDINFSHFVANPKTSRKRVRDETILQVVSVASVPTSSNPRYFKT